MEKRVNRLVSAYDGDGTILTIGCELKYDMVTVWRKCKRYGDPTEVEFEVSWWSGRSTVAADVREFAEALMEADKFIHSIKTDKVFVVRWEQDGEKRSRGILHRSLGAAKHWLQERVNLILSEHPEIDHELPFEVALRVGEWSELVG